MRDGPERGEKVEAGVEVKGRLETEDRGRKTERKASIPRGRCLPGAVRAGLAPRLGPAYHPLGRNPTDELTGVRI
jgi:hypothetical protein